MARNKMTPAEFDRLSVAEQEAIWDAESRAARDRFRKVRCTLPADPEADPFSGHRPEY